MTLYVPKHFEQGDPALLLEVMQRHTFATLVSNGGDVPFVTHLPLLATRTESGMRIAGHVAKANPHWKALEANPRALAVFHGPHAYISPTLYKSADRVPTWNYVTVHASGRVAVDHGSDAKLEMLAALIEHHEPAYRAQFDALDAPLRQSLLDAIVSFTMEVDKLEGKFKLGQNRLADNRPEMQTVFDSGSEDQRGLAGWMKRLGYWE